MGRLDAHVPSGKVEMIGNRTVTLIQRFDRYWNSLDAPTVHAGLDTLGLAIPGEARVEKRLAFVSGLTLLGYQPVHKPVPQLPLNFQTHLSLPASAWG